jgi:CDP-glycerol glycerophosphotransferase
MSTPTVTVIVPGRDVGAFAEEALASLRTQTRTDFRALLVDDASRDATAEIFAATAADDPRFTLVRHEVAQGLGASRNEALALVDTPYVGFFDADDVMTPGALDLLVGSLEDSGSDIAVGAYVRLRADAAGHYSPGVVQPWVAASTSPGRRRTTLADHPDVSGNIVAWSKVSRTDFWQDLRFPEGVAYEDQVVAQQMYTRARTFDVIPDVVVHWRLRADGTSITQSKAQLPVLRDYLTALRGGIRVLHRAGARASVTARLELILAMDVAPLLDIASAHPDPAYAAEVDGFIAELRALPEFADAVPDPAIAAALAW